MLTSWSDAKTKLRTFGGGTRFGSSCEFQLIDMLKPNNAYVSLLAIAILPRFSANHVVAKRDSPRIKKLLRTAAHWHTHYQIAAARRFTRRRRVSSKHNRRWREHRILKRAWMVWFTMLWFQIIIRLASVCYVSVVSPTLYSDLRQCGNFDGNITKPFAISATTTPIVNYTIDVRTPASHHASTSRQVTACQETATRNFRGGAVVTNVWIWFNFTMYIKLWNGLFHIIVKQSCVDAYWFTNNFYLAAHVKFDNLFRTFIWARIRHFFYMIVIHSCNCVV